VDRPYGRDRELLHASAVLADTRRSGATSLLTVEGAPGIGKSTLLRAFAVLARQQGYRVSCGGAEEASQMVPLATLLSALRSGPEPLLSAQDFAELGNLYDRQPWLVERLADAPPDRRRAGPSSCCWTTSSGATSSASSPCASSSTAWRGNRSAGSWRGDPLPVERSTR
jgi:energy-coupling factor transporter ATP-binding protein EcfA2